MAFWRRSEPLQVVRAEPEDPLARALTERVEFATKGFLAVLGPEQLLDVLRRTSPTVRPSMCRHAAATYRQWANELEALARELS